MDEKSKILIVEDEGIVSSDIKQTLLKLNYNVVGIARTGEEAVSKALELQPNLILMDIMLAGKIGGIEASQKIQNLLDIPVIYLTAYADENTISKAKLTNPYGYILKPYDDKTLYFTIEMALFKHSSYLKIKESENLHRSLVELTPFAVAIISDEKILYANPSFLKLYETNSENDVIGKSIFQFFSSRFEQMVRDFWNEKDHNKVQHASVEDKFIKSNKSKLEAEVIIIPSKYFGKDSYQVIIRDIGELKRKERIHQATEKILQSVSLLYSEFEQYEYIRKSVIDLLQFNEVYYSLYNDELKKIEIPDELFLTNQNIQNKEFLLQFSNFIAAANKPQLFLYDDIRNLIIDKTLPQVKLIPQVLAGVPYQINDKLTLIIVIKDDHDASRISNTDIELLTSISLPLTRAVEQKLMEVERKRDLEKLKELNRTKDNFFSIVSHDLRSPFDSIIGFNEILRNDFENLSKDEIYFYLDSMYQTSKHVYNLMNNLLQYSRFQLGKVDFNPKPISLSEVINKNLEMITGKALKKEIQILSNPFDDMNLIVDEDMVNSVFLNILTNAIKFTPRRGRIILFVKKNEDFAEISVRDNGVGMTESEVNNLFKPSHKNSKRGTESEIGTGLGLLLVKEYLEKMGGQIKILSEPDKGTEVIFTLPLKNSKKE